MRQPHNKIVLYHGVTGERAGGIFNYRGKFISPDAFAKQLGHFKRHYTVLPLAELVSKLESGTLPQSALAITFDDGYANNYQAAFPLLRAAGLPATFFITTGFIEGAPLGVDVIEHAIGTTTHESLTLQLGSVAHTFQLRTRQECIAADVTVRVYFKTLSPSETKNFLCMLIDKTGVDLTPVLPSSPYAPMSWAEMQKMEQGGMTFAPHTVTHSILSHASRAEAREEIARSQKKLAERLARPLGIFAYPNGGKGDYTTETVAILKEQGYTAALTTEPAYIPSPANAFALPRYTLDGTNNIYRFRLVMSGVYNLLIKFLR
ncbi:MAG: polysaccharide deacetylase family protein [Minisyncoccia bacterium]|jgi:peptidoglycan/xylan/chitin deacetylase (PgdA/CDA1 family)